MSLDTFRHYVWITVIGGYVGSTWGGVWIIPVVLTECFVLPYVYGFGKAYFDSRKEKTDGR